VAQNSHQNQTNKGDKTMATKTNKQTTSDFVTPFEETQDDMEVNSVVNTDEISSLFGENDRNFKIWKKIQAELSKPFSPEEHNYRPINITKNGAWVAYYVDLRSMMERLQNVVGHHFNFYVFPIEPKTFTTDTENAGVNVKAVLSLFIGSEVLSVEDFGYAQKGSSEPLKSATTDALRRVLSHIGIGRYLYKLPRVFIRGRQTETGFKFDADPIKVLEKLLSNPTNEKVVFYPERGESDGHEEQPTVGDWDTDIDGFRKLYGVKQMTDKQIRAFMRLVKPTDSEAKALEETSDPDSYIKYVLDNKLGGKK
jgi:hypothetical protein